VAVAAPCRVVTLVDEPSRFGFAYGTLSGHPEMGEELFEVRTDAAGEVRFCVRAFSRPGTLVTRVAGPIGRWCQSRAVRAYVASPQDVVQSSS
jgi:uncharacterized protein (UPF0548 family)